MINCVNNSLNFNNNSIYSTDNLSCQNKKNNQNKISQNQISSENNNTQNVSFGYQDQSSSPFQGLKNIALSLTNDVIGFFGINAALLWLQKTVNSGLLINKIDKHFTKGITEEDNNKLVNAALEMRNEVGTPDIHYGPKGEAYYTHMGNEVVIGKDKHTALFHELGHAYEENKTSFLKNLQRGRGHYSEAAILLYMLMGQRQKKDSDFANENQGFLSKLAHSDAIVPLVAYAPELVTEAAASMKGVKFLNKKVKSGELEKSLVGKIKKSYLTCFGTYLFIPLSIMLVDAIRNSADKAIQKHRNQSSFF